MTSRGCPFNCTYCFNHAYKEIYGVANRQYVRRRSVENVIAELVHLRKTQRIRSVYFLDDTFILDKAYTLALMEAYRREIGLPFYCLVRADLVDDDICRALKEAGCAYVALGVESGSERLRRQVLNRYMSNRQILEAARLIKRHRLKLITINMLCLPTETLDDMLATVDLNLRLRPDGLFTHTFYPYPGTALCAFARKQGLLSDERYEEVVCGIEGYNSTTVLDHPFGREGYNIKIALPILNRFRGLRRYALRTWIHRRHSLRLLFLLSLMCVPLYSGWDRFQRLKEQLLFPVKSRWP